MLYSYIKFASYRFGGGGILASEPFNQVELFGERENLLLSGE